MDLQLFIKNILWIFFVIIFTVKSMNHVDAIAFATPNPLRRQKRQGGGQDFAENMKPWMELGQKYGPISKEN